jgi:hypothetical protein
MLTKARQTIEKLSTKGTKKQTDKQTLPCDILGSVGCADTN